MKTISMNIFLFILGAVAAFTYVQYRLDVVGRITFGTKSYRVYMQHPAGMDLRINNTTHLEH